MISSAKLCDEKIFNNLLAALESGTEDGLAQTNQLLVEFPEDGRLHFLRGSMLASIGRPIEALPALKKAVELAPDLAIARFQLGFFFLTANEADEALSVWAPLANLPHDHYLRLFVAGLAHLIRDEFSDTVTLLKKGILQNKENLPLNRDMNLIIDQVEKLETNVAKDGDEEISPTSLLLGRFAPNRTTH